MEWLRCNNCYTRAANAKQSFSLTQCGHAYCYQCAVQASKQCFICNTVNVRTVLLQEPLHPTIGLYFAPLKTTLEQVERAANFQEGQIQILMKKYDQVEKKYMFAKEAYRNMESGALKMHKKYKHEKEEDKKQINKLQNEITQLKYALQGIQKNSYPTFHNVHRDASPACSSSNYSYNGDSGITFSTPSVSNIRRSALLSSADVRYKIGSTERDFQNSKRKNLNLLM